MNSCSVGGCRAVVSESEIVIATKLGARPRTPGTSYTDNAEGLSARAIRESAERSRERLGVGKVRPALRAHRGPADAFAGDRRGLCRTRRRRNRRPARREQPLGLASGTGAGPCCCGQTCRATRCCSTTTPTYASARTRGPLSQDGEQGQVGGDLLELRTV